MQSVCPEGHQLGLTETDLLFHSLAAAPSHSDERRLCSPPLGCWEGGGGHLLPCSAPIPLKQRRLLGASGAGSQICALSATCSPLQCPNQ